MLNYIYKSVIFNNYETRNGLSLLSMHVIFLQVIQTFFIIFLHACLYVLSVYVFGQDTELLLHVQFYSVKLIFNLFEFFFQIHLFIEDVILKLLFKFFL